jgi:hypothetical protein
MSDEGRKVRIGRATAVDRERRRGVRGEGWPCPVPAENGKKL